jgi:hypothetical protein
MQRGRLTRLPTQKQERMWIGGYWGNSFSWVCFFFSVGTLNVGASDKCEVLFLVRIFYKAPQSKLVCVCVCGDTGCVRVLEVGLLSF